MANFQRKNSLHRPSSSDTARFHHVHCRSRRSRESPPVRTACVIMLYSAVCLFCGALFGKQDGVNVGQDTSRGNGNTSQKSVQFLIVLDGQGNVTGDDTRFLVVTGGISGQFQNFGAQIFQDGSQVHGGSGSHAGGVLALTQVTSDTSDGELQTSLGGCRDGFLFSASSLSFSCCVWKTKERVVG
jgi:hypothetical protein